MIVSPVLDRRDAVLQRIVLPLFSLKDYTIIIPTKKEKVKPSPSRLEVVAQGCTPKLQPYVTTHSLFCKVLVPLVGQI